MLPDSENTVVVPLHLILSGVSWREVFEGADFRPWLIRSSKFVAENLHEESTDNGTGDDLYEVFEIYISLKEKDFLKTCTGPLVFCQ